MKNFKKMTLVALLVTTLLAASASAETKKKKKKKHAKTTTSQTVKSHATTKTHPAASTTHSSAGTPAPAPQKKSSTLQYAPSHAAPAPYTYTPVGTPKYGVGIFLGAPIAFTGKYWLDERTAIDGQLAYISGGWLGFYADYLYHWRHPFNGDFGSATEFMHQLNPYVGAGALAFLSTGTYSTTRGFYSDHDSGGGFGIRVPAGVEWMPGKPPLGVYVELAPGLGISASSFFFFQGGFGARWYFN